MNIRYRWTKFTFMLTLIGLSLVACSCGQMANNFNSLADEAAQQFNAIVQEVSTPTEARDAIEYYKTMEMNFIKLKAKNGIDAPLEMFYLQTSDSLSKLNSEFKTHPEYGSFEKLMKKLGE